MPSQNLDGSSLRSAWGTDNQIVSNFILVVTGNANEIPTKHARLKGVLPQAHGDAQAFAFELLTPTAPTAPPT